MGKVANHAGGGTGLCGGTSISRIFHILFWAEVCTSVKCDDGSLCDQIVDEGVHCRI